MVAVCSTNHDDKFCITMSILLHVISYLKLSQGLLTRDWCRLTLTLHASESLLEWHNLSQWSIGIMIPSECMWCRAHIQPLKLHLSSCILALSMSSHQAGKTTRFLILLNFTYFILTSCSYWTFSNTKQLSYTKYAIVYKYAGYFFR